MDKKMMRRLIMLITYAIVLVAVLLKINAVERWVKQVLSSFAPLFIGFAIAFVLDRPCNFFARLYSKGLKKRDKLARPLAVVTAYVIFLAVIAAILALVIPELVDSIEMFIGNISTYAANLQKGYDKLVEILDLEMIADLDLSGTVNGALQKMLSGVLDVLTNTLPQLITATGKILSALVTLVLSLVFSVYMLGGAPKLVAQIRRLAVHYLPDKMVKPTLAVARLTADTFTQYVSGQLTEACILGCLCFIGMSIFGFSYAPLISVLIAVTALIPVAGAYIGAVAAVVLLLMISPMQAVWFLVFLVVLQQLEGNLIYPRVVGTSIGLPGIWVLGAVTVSGSLMGIVGLLIGVPVTAVIYTLIRNDLHRREEKGNKK